MIRILIILLLFSSTAFGQREFFALGKPATFVAFSYDADAMAYFTAWETATSSTMPTVDKNAFNTFVLYLKANSLWAKFDNGDIAPMYAGTAAGQAICLRLHQTLTFVGSPTHASTGVDWNGTDQYAQTGWIPSTAIPSGNLFHLSYYSGENVVTSGRADIGSNSSTGGNKFSQMRINQTTNVFNGYGGSATPVTGDVTSGKSGLFVVSRVSTTDLSSYKNGTNLATLATSDATTLPIVEIYLGANNNNGTANIFGSRECRFASWGTEMSAAEVALFNTGVEALMDALGRGVQP